MYVWEMPYKEDRIHLSAWGEVSIENVVPTNAETHDVIDVKKFRLHLEWFLR
jgi:hypothetical protein